MASGKVSSFQLELLVTKQSAGSETFTISNLDEYRFFCVRCTYQSFDNNLCTTYVPKEWFKYPPNPAGINSAIHAAFAPEINNYQVSVERTGQNTVKVSTKGQYDMVRFYGIR